METPKLDKDKILQPPSSEPQIESEKGPKIVIEIFFSAHLSPEDLRGLEEKLEKADVFVPEFPGWTDSIADHFQKVSQGIETPEVAFEKIKKILIEIQKQSEESQEEIKSEEEKEEKEESQKVEKKLLFEDIIFHYLKILHNKEKIVIFADISYDPKDPKRIIRVLPWGVWTLYYFRPEISLDPFSQTLEEIKNRAYGFLKNNEEREQHIVSQLEEKIQEAISQNEDLLKKDQVNVLVFLGAMHVGVTDKLRKKGFNTKRTFKTKPFVYGYSGKLFLMLQRVKEVSKDLLAKFWFERLLSEYFFYSLIEKFGRDSLKTIQFIREIVSKFNLEEIEKIFYEVNNPQAKIEDLLVKYPKEKGIEMLQISRET
jgi:hypothetical protein